MPYIPAVLHNWEQPYRGRASLVLHVFEVGRLQPVEVGAAQPRPRQVLAYVLEHPRHGPVVLDTGLNHAIAAAADYLPAEVTLTLRVEQRAGEDLPAQMRKAGLDPAAVRRVVLSNLRVSHAGEVEAFANARVSVSSREHEVAQRAPLGYLAAEYDDVAQWDPLTFDAAPPLGTMSAALDLLGDGSLMAIDAAGPTAGNLAFLVRLAPRPVLIAADVAPHTTHLRRAAPPPALHDRAAWWQTIWRVKRFAFLEPQLLALPGNEMDAWRGHGAVRVHDFAAPAARRAAGGR